MSPTDGWPEAVSTIQIGKSGEGWDLGENASLVRLRLQYDEIVTVSGSLRAHIMFIASMIDCLPELQRNDEAVKRLLHAAEAL